MQVQCPNCQAQVVWNEAATWRPFCSERCRLIDLGEWFNEEHKIAGESADGEPATQQWHDNETIER